MGSGRWWAWNPDTGRSTTDAGGLTTDAGTLRMQDFLTRGTSCSGRVSENPAFWAHRLAYKTWKTTLPPCCTQPEVKKQTISHDIARLSLPGLRQFPPPSGCPMPLRGELPRMAEHPCADPAENAARQGETSLFRFRRPTNTKPNPSAVQNPHSKYTGWHTKPGKPPCRPAVHSRK